MMQSSADPAEIAKFEAMAREWWDPKGKFKPLHLMNPVRLGYVRDAIAWHFDRDVAAADPFLGIDIVDVGTGGGLLAEPLARLGAKVTGIDAAKTNIEVAKRHAADSGVAVDYRHLLAEDLVAEGARFDVVVALEIVEHVADPQSFVDSLFALLKPGGILIMSTLNRNPKSYLFAIIGAEYVMRWLPKGTHDWQKFITPDELAMLCASSGFNVIDRRGMVFNPLGQSWSLSHRDLSVNYAMTAVRPV